MNSGELKIRGLQVWLSVALVAIIFVANPTRSHVVRRDIDVNELCGDKRLYFEEKKKCYPVLRQGPCGELMVLEPSQDDKNIGECNCQYVKGGGPTCAQRPKVFWEQESRCYYIYDQGPCEIGEWVVPQKDERPSCETIPCMDKYTARLQREYYNVGSGQFIFPRNGECYETLTTEGEFCLPTELVFFIGNDSLNLHCSRIGVCGLTFTRDTNCADGSSPDFQGGCEPVTAL
ncbi:unnamed protein product [Allacma fusca]|uniref:DUF4789 domain-containing protein n=1 Tax=Allacma fusca TaxID=39272 RepID=A0A8J2LR04_9HEXA|nr:unnamed protein product [Allacma fusca]